MNIWLLLGVAAASALLSLASVRASVHIAHALDALDHPDGGRKTQVTSIPRLGGVAVASALTVSVMVGLAVTGRQDQFEAALGVLIPALVAAVVGLIDDTRGLGPYLRLALQVGIGALAFALGTRISVTGIGALDAAILIVWIVVIVNGLNLLDNSDGLAGTTTLTAAVGATVISVMFGQQLVSLMGAALIGVTLGFLALNWHPARVYMGDSGAYFLGVLLALLVVRLRPEGVPSAAGAAIAILLVALPLIDTTYVVVKRLRLGIHPFTAGRDHLSHVLQDRGHSVPHSVLALQLVQGVTVSSGAVLAWIVSK